MAYISTQLELLKSTRFHFSGDGRYNLPHANSVHIPENKFARFILHATENDLGEHKQHATTRVSQNNIVDTSLIRRLT